MANNALSFDGVNDYVAITIDEPETGITHELWFKTTDGNTVLFSIISGDLGETGSDRNIYLDNGNLGVRVWDTEVLTTTGVNLADGQWHHVAHVIGEGGQKVYIDGNLVLNGTKTKSDFDWQTKAVIGHSYHSSDDTWKYFQGEIDDVRIWNVARTAEEIKANYNSSLTGNETGLAGYWNFEEGSGTIANDLAGNNDGTLVNGPTWVVADNPNFFTEPVNLTGTSANNTLNGTGFNDTLSGLGGNDTLDGRSGIDSLIGGKGNDTYIVDNIGDIVTELAGEGTDLVKSSVSYKLPDNVENLTLTGNENLTGKGNQLNNKLTGNTKNDRLFGYGGNDNLNGGAGNDSLFGGAGNDTLTGGTGNDYLSGGVGNDNLTGGAGQDILTGSGGKDNFIFLTPNEGLDIITDFSPTDDTLQIKASAFGFNSTGAIATDQLVTGEQAIDNNDVFIYDNSTGILSFDKDANGALAPVPLVMLDNIPAITNADIVLF